MRAKKIVATTIVPSTTLGFLENLKITKPVIIVIIKMIKIIN